MTSIRSPFFFFLLVLIFLSPLRVSAMAPFRDEEKKDAARRANEEQRVPIQRHQERGTTASSTVEEGKIEETKSTLDESAAADQEETKEEIKTALSLEDFREALERHPNAGRLIVVRESNGALLIQPREASPNRFGSSRAENQTTMDTLRSLIPPEVSGDPNLANLLAYRERSTAMAMHIDPLTPERLRGILNRVEELAPISAGPTLEDFQAAASTYEKAERLILDPVTGAIRPWNRGDSRVRGKDKTIIEALTKSLSSTFPGIAVEEIVKALLPSPSMLEKAQGKKVVLSSETLERILEAAHEAAAEEHAAAETPLGLAQFRFARHDPSNRGAERLIITGRGAHARIEAQAGKNHREDRLIRTKLKEALRSEGHHKDFIQTVMREELPYLSAVARIRKITPPLSLEKLITILQRAEDAMQEMRWRQSTHSIVLPPPAVRNRVAMRNALRSVIETSLRNIGIEARGFAGQVSESLIKKSPEEKAAEHARELEQDRLEKAELEQTLRSLIHRDRDLDFLNAHFHDAEEAALAAEDGDNRAMRARWDAEKNEELLSDTRELFEQLKAVLEEKKGLADLGIEESILSKISQGADMAGVILGMFNVPLINPQGVAAAISRFAHLADRHFTIAEAREAYRTWKQAIEADQEAIAGSEKLDESASQRRIGAKAHEEAKQKEIREEATRFAEVLTALPKDGSTAEEWNEWATHLICETDLTEEEAPIKTYLLSKQAQKNRFYVLAQIGRLWAERMKFAKSIEEQAADEATTTLQLARDHYQRLREEEQQTKAEAKAARTRLEEAAKAKTEWLSKREELRREQTTLEKQWKQGAVEREETVKALTTKKEAFDTHQTKKEEIDKAYQEAAAQAKDLSRRAAIARAKAFEESQKLERLKKAHERRQNRFETCTEADRAILNKIKIHFPRVIYFPTLRESQATALRFAAYRYNNATEAEAQGRKKEADLYRNSAQAYEAEAAAWDSDGKQAKLHQRRAQSLQYAAKSYNGAAKAEAQSRKKEADLYRKRAQAYEAQAAAWERHDEEQAELHQERAWALQYAAESYKEAATAEAQGRKKEADLYRKKAQAYEAEGEAREQQIEALAHDDKEQTKLYEKRTEAPEPTAESYNEAAQGEAHRENSQDSDSGTFFDEEIVAIDFHEKRAVAFRSAAKNYKAAAQAEAQERKKVADYYGRSAQVFEEGAAAWERRDEKQAKLHEEKAWALEFAAESYNKAAEAEAQGRKEAAELYQKCARVWKTRLKASGARAAASERGDEKQAQLHQKRTWALDSAAESYKEAATAEAQGRKKEADLYRKTAQASEAEAAALARQIEALEQKGKSSAPAPDPRRPDKDTPDSVPKKNCTIS